MMDATIIDNVNCIMQTHAKVCKEYKLEKTTAHKRNLIERLTGTTQEPPQRWTLCLLVMMLHSNTVLYLYNNAYNSQVSASVDEASTIIAN